MPDIQSLRDQAQRAFDRYAQDQRQAPAATNESALAEMLCDGAKKGLIDKMARALAQGVSVEATDGIYNAVQTAAMNGQLGSLEFLVSRGAGIDSTTRYCPLTPAYLALKDGANDAVLEGCIRFGARIDFQDASQRTLLHLACQHERTASVRLLLAHGADSRARDKDGRTPLHEAARHHHLAAVLPLVQAGAQLDAEDRRGQRPLHEAQCSCSGEMMHALVALGASTIDFKPLDSEPQELLRQAMCAPPLVCAVQSRVPEILVFALEYWSPEASDLEAAQYMVAQARQPEMQTLLSSFVARRRARHALGETGEGMQGPSV